MNRRGLGIGTKKNKPSLALRAAAFQQHMATKMFVSPVPEPLIKQSSPKVIPPKKSKSKPEKPKAIPTSTIFESSSVAEKQKKYSHQLTLAEQLGIVEPPPPPLTDEQFETVKIDAQKRGFFNEVCPICLEKFGPDNMVLLSCSHLLHATCLMNFRRFTRGQVQKCPICRSQYEFVEVKAESAYHQRCARDIQRVVRGFLIRDKIGREAPAGSALHRKWVINRTQDASNRLVKALDHQNDAVDAMLTAVDHDLEYARAIMKAVEERDKRVDWSAIKRKALERGSNQECPVCLRVMNENDSEITSCGHMFHTQCLHSWLTYCENGNNQPTCPVCRTIFQHQPLNHPETKQNDDFDEHLRQLRAVCCENHDHDHDHC